MIETWIDVAPRCTRLKPGARAKRRDLVNWRLVIMRCMVIAC